MAPTTAILAALAATLTAPIVWVHLFPDVNFDILSTSYWAVALIGFPAIWLTSTLVTVRWIGRRGWTLLLLTPLALAGWWLPVQLVISCLSGNGCFTP